MISWNTIVRSAMVRIPFHFLREETRKTIGNKYNPSTLLFFVDKFWYIDWMFFDRSGWEVLKVHKSTASNTSVINASNIQTFIDKNVIKPTTSADPNISWDMLKLKVKPRDLLTE